MDPVTLALIAVAALVLLSPTSASAGSAAAGGAPAGGPPPGYATTPWGDLPIRDVGENAGTAAPLPPGARTPGWIDPETGQLTGWVDPATGKPLRPIGVTRDARPIFAGGNTAGENPEPGLTMPSPGGWTGVANVPRTPTALPPIKAPPPYGRPGTSFIDGGQGSGGGLSLGRVVR